MLARTRYLGTGQYAHRTGPPTAVYAMEAGGIATRADCGTREGRAVCVSGDYWWELSKQRKQSARERPPESEVQSSRRCPGRRHLQSCASARRGRSQSLAACACMCRRSIRRPRWRRGGRCGVPQARQQLTAPNHAQCTGAVGGGLALEALLVGAAFIVCVWRRSAENARLSLAGHGLGL